MKETESLIRLFNTEEEIGVRLLFILATTKEKMSLSRLIYYDYFALHLDDIDKNLESLHPSNPSHSAEIVVRRKIIMNAVEYMALKKLLDVKYTTQGIYYKFNSITENFLSYFISDYSKQLKDNIAIVHNLFSDLTDKRLDKYVKKNIGNWVGEFEKEYQLELLGEGEENE